MKDNAFYRYLTLAVLALGGGADLSFGQPTNARPKTVWRAAHGNEFWEIVDDGAVEPVLSGTYRSNSVTWTLHPSHFDYSRNELRTQVLRGKEERSMVLKYLEHREDDSILALCHSNRLIFREEKKP